jgi:ligand-binding SRPBCC domain-containing protein
MPIIETSLFIAAPVDVCFDLARNIGAHMLSTAKTRERAIAGRTSGLIDLGETVTWEAVHFGIRQRLTVKITEFDRPNRFVNEMVRGAFKRFRHVHTFAPQDNDTLMCDAFDFTSPLGPLGLIADRLFLTGYMRAFLVERNLHLKRMAEEA